MLQSLKKHKVNCGRLSVDRTLEAYYRSAAQVNNNTVRIGYAPILHKQAKAIKESDEKLLTRLRKDMLDSFVGAIYNAVNDVTAEPIYTWHHENSRSVGTAQQVDGTILEKLP